MNLIDGEVELHQLASLLGKYILDDWLPSLERASQWNKWTEEERLIQFAGHLCGWALQEWNLLSDNERATFDTAVKSLRSGGHVHNLTQCVAKDQLLY